MDFRGQELSERLYQLVLVLFAVAGFVVGYGTGSFSTMMGVFGVGVALALVCSVPDWVYFNQHPLHWLPPLNPGGEDGGGKGKGTGGGAAAGAAKGKQAAGKKAQRR